ncbi:hypothetical protein [Actinomycetospora chibensis]|uniref:Phage tail protein (Tail_P2_I) n=1 Tax=Actinomycetospora chibensis TaxID=663606 RepID=A0ABV9RSL2_9PSEU|nr:hypothetical protein [Actinomycetospora chibensis]MDD7926955.1 hypothetical protein [Actinomycetospora chibensis]
MTTDRLYDLLPAVHRRRDADVKQPLRALLAIVAEQLDVVEQDIERLYDDWFVETCSEWVLPYIGELVGFTPDSDVPVATSGELARVLFPRAQVANTIGDRRRRGTLAVLEKLARNAGGWPATAVEFSRLTAGLQSLVHPNVERGRIVDLRDADALDRLDGPFESTAPVVDTRQLSARSALGRHAPSAVGLFAWRLAAVPVTLRQPYAQESVGPQAYTFSVLGVDTTLFGRGGGAGELAVPAPLRRHTFVRRLDELYGADRDVQIWWVPPGGTPADPPPRELISRERIVVADLTDWTYRTPRGKVAVDPVLGRIAFPSATTEQPRRGIWVSYRYGFPAQLGGGEYERALPTPAAHSRLYRVGAGAPFARLGQALRHWYLDRPDAAVIEVVDSSTYTEPISVELGEGQSLELRAASGTAPVLRLLDWQTDQPDALTVTGEEGSCFTIDGFLVTGRGMRVAGELAHLEIGHCTLVPGWGLRPDCRPRRPGEASLELDDVDAVVTIAHSILGPIRVVHDEVRSEPERLTVTDSVLDASDPHALAVSAANGDTAHAELLLRRVTVFGSIRTHAVELAENCIFTGPLRVARRQLGCVRFSSVPEGSRTPRRFRCQPDTALATAAADLARSERLRLSPDFVSTRYGTPNYAQLDLTCADEIRTGAEDGAEMGVYHDLFQPQRLANVRNRLRDQTPAGVYSAVILVN